MRKLMNTRIISFDNIYGKVLKKEQHSIFNFELKTFVGSHPNYQHTIEAYDQPNLLVVLLFHSNLVKNCFV